MSIKKIKRGAVLTALASVLGGCAFSSKEAASVAIIGGADGPTAVFITSKPDVFLIIAAIVGVIAVIAAVVAVKNKRQ